jgi:penicillin-binding protein 2
VFALVASLFATLLVRVFWVQVLDPNKPVQTAGLTHDGRIVIPAPRGLIVDAAGRPLVQNTSAQRITVDRERLLSLPDQGRAVLARLAALLKTSPATLAHEITPCSPKVSAPCWTGEPFAPVPVATQAATDVVLAIAEHREDFPGVALQTVTLPEYPYGTLASHVLGYTGQVTADDVKANPDLVDADMIGRTGLEAYYDSVLRGTDGAQVVPLDPQGYAVGAGYRVAPMQGDTLVTSIDLHLQQLVEQSLREEIAEKRKEGRPATGGAALVMDPQTGRVLAIASYPTYDPRLFIGGISNADYAKLIAPDADDPLVSRAIAGEYAPGSTFKLITSSSLLIHHEISTTDTYACPGSVTIDGRVKTNYDSEVLGPVTLENALGYSCDTFFYVPAANEYYADQNRIAAGQKPDEWLQQTASLFGVGTAPGLDVPAGEQAPGSYADRETRMSRWKAMKSEYCAAAKRGYPDVADRAQRAYLTQLAAENCTDGWRYRAGDNADMSIGQGETTMSPLQLAVAYSALVNGGRILEPRLGWAVVDGSGKVVRTIGTTVRHTLPVPQKYFNYIANSLNFSRGWAVSGAFAYIGSPYQNELGGKTGTAEVEGKQDTSWLATWGPIYHDAKGDVRARFVIVGMIEQAGTGATAAGPMLKRIWDGIMGVGGKPVLPGKQPPTKLPDVKPQVAVSR